MDRYRLAPVRDARDRDERIKRGDLAGAVGDARVTADALAAAADRVLACRRVIAEAEGRRPLARTIAELVVLDRDLGRRRAELAELIGAEVRAEATHHGKLDEVDVARGRLTRARADRQVIERHFERWRIERRKLAERREGE